jgi:hypothetical protein
MSKLNVPIEAIQKIAGKITARIAKKLGAGDATDN